MRPIPFNTATPPGVKIALPKATPVPIKIRARVSNLPRGREGFLRWLEKFAPRLAEKVAVEQPGLYDLNATLDAHLGEVAATSANTPNWTDTIKNVLSGALQVYQQKKIVDMQLDRAKKGLSPLDVDLYADASSVKVGIDPQTQKSIFTLFGIGAAIVVGIVVLKATRSRR